MMSKSLQIQILCIFLVNGASSTPTTKSLGPRRISSECGGSLVGAGTIDYKLGEEYEPNEECVWTLVNPNRELLTVDLISANFAEAGDRLEILYMQRSNSSSSNELKIISPGPSDSPHCDGPELYNRNDWCILPSHLIFLIFRSNSNVQRYGFSVKVSVSETPNYPRRETQPFTLTQGSGWIDYVKSTTAKTSSWTVVNVNSFTLHRFNGTLEASCLAIYQVGSPPLILLKMCRALEAPLHLVLKGPLIILLESDASTTTTASTELKFYWNLEEPPMEWIPEPGLAKRLLNGGGVQGIVALLQLFALLHFGVNRFWF